MLKNEADAQFDEGKIYESVTVCFNADSLLGHKIMKRHTIITEKLFRIPYVCNSEKMFGSAKNVCKFKDIVVITIKKLGLAIKML